MGVVCAGSRKAGRTPVATGSSSSTNLWAHNAANDLTAITDTVQGTTSSLGYDAADELQSLRVLSGTTPTQNLALSYNADGDRTSQSDSVSGSSSSDGYDQEDRLITATTVLTQSSYAYDGDGLRQSKTVSGTTTRSMPSSAP